MFSCRIVFNLNDLLPWTVIVVSLSFHLVPSLYNQPSVGTLSRSASELLNPPTFWYAAPIIQCPFSYREILNIEILVGYLYLTMEEYPVSSFIVFPCWLPILDIISNLVNCKLIHLHIMWGANTVETQVTGRRNIFLSNIILNTSTFYVIVGKSLKILIFKSKYTRN